MAEGTPAEPPRPQKWYQWVIVYPSLALALGGAVPTVLREVKAWRLGVQSSRLELVEEQQRLWERNLPCLEEQGVYAIDGPGGIVVGVTLCPQTGDILVRYHLNQWPPHYKWVGRPAELPRK